MIGLGFTILFGWVIVLSFRVFVQREAIGVLSQRVRDLGWKP